ncbi:26S proteasome non-ATPase regulatory subunit [Coemansia sp. RSA 1822]|nr:26S proteasome non-ATPase regulatory subunit [Coemansia sp. RSA 638]KAJ2125593.1 26S proteasome non-ATPase regulatory subunit [Coemansia sp. RSA 720]KAJ2539697.1 26S proteasome non-ATPase regulatory subunit [Coemansia sp. RSA 1853]KAJ2567103.1 26S proteasome non-ATPase regulatory subunit [Coemansia sp. RSA 1822]
MSNSTTTSMEVEVSSEQKQAETRRILLEGTIKFLQRGIAAAETHYVYRALRSAFALRKRLQPDVIAEIVAAYSSSANSQSVQSCLKSVLECLQQSPAENTAAGVCEPEVCLFLGLLAMLYLLDNSHLERGVELSNALISVIPTAQRRTLDPISSRVFFYFSRFFEVADRLSDARPALLSALQAATLAGMKETKAMLLTLLLRNYLHYKLYDQAERLTAKSSFPVDAPNNLLARYLYYMGYIEAIQLNYSQAQTHLLEATRKAPSNAATAGFQQTVHKIYVIVELLMGNIPERSLFRVPTLKKPLLPYLELAQAVRVGDLNKFQEVVSKYQDRFLKDSVLILIQRLRHNVIKAGIRSISTAYSRISLRDICLKLHLDSEEDAEYIVAKAIRDGVIDATIDHEKGFVQSADVHNVYETSDPQYAFDKRITFCLGMYNDSVKSMRYPGSDHRKELASAIEAIKRERELAQELENDDYDGDSDEDAMDEDL